MYGYNVNYNSNEFGHAIFIMGYEQQIPEHLLIML